MNDIPISDAVFSEVLARVSFRCIHLYACQLTEADQHPRTQMASVSMWLRDSGFPMLSTWVQAYSIRWAPFYTTIDVRADFINAARLGETWRRVAFPAYKSARRDPRVTNRGVTSRRRSSEG